MPRERFISFLRIAFSSKRVENVLSELGYVPVRGREGSSLSWVDKLNKRLEDQKITPSADAHGRFVTDVTCEEIKLKGSQKTSIATIVAGLFSLVGIVAGATLSNIVLKEETKKAAGKIVDLSLELNKKSAEVASL